MSSVQPTISACILARNEEGRIEDALRSLVDWTDQIIVIDNESEDRTVEIARRYTDDLLTAPQSANFDAERNRAIEVATGDWMFFLDADERVPPALGRELRRLVAEQGDQFEALVIPFKHYFCGEWIQHSGWWPGYCRPQLLKKGCFRYSERLHTGVQVEGRTQYFPADDAELAITHYSYDNLDHYLEKLNRYTTGEAVNLGEDGHSHSWQAQIAHFMHDWGNYYDRGRGDLDGMHGFVLAFMSAFYRYAARAKLWDQRRQQGETNGAEPVPANLTEVLAFMQQVHREGAERWIEAPPAAPLATTPRLPLIWKSPLLDPSGYADGARNQLLGLIEAGEEVAVLADRWGEIEAGIPEVEAEAFRSRGLEEEQSAELLVTYTLPALQRRSPLARFQIGRTMFETDRLPAAWVEQLNTLDRIWVPSEFNRETFMRSGVEAEKLALIPEVLDTEAFAAEVEPWPVPGEEAFRFLTVFDWTLHKGWDLLLTAFVQEFGDNPEVGLVIKTWSSNHYSLDDIRGQADAFLQEQFGQPLTAFPNIHLWQEVIPHRELPRLYRGVDAFVLPTRGEGWGRPLMEAMAAGLPTIATDWSGLTEYYSDQVGYPLRYRLMPVSEAGAREIPSYRGHCWAEPDLQHLRQLLRNLAKRPASAQKRAKAAQRHVQQHYSRPAVAKLVQRELALCRELAAQKPDSLPVAKGPAAESGREAMPPPFKPKANPVPLDPPGVVDFQERLGRAARVQWIGDQTVLSSLALVNRELCLGLVAPGDVELALTEPDSPWRTLTARDDPRFGPLFSRIDTSLEGEPDVTVRHHFPPNWERPPAGKLVVIQPWEYGHLPRDWVQGATEQADEVWTYSRFVRDIYVRSGVPAEKVKVVPLGYNPDVFTPEGPQYPLPTKKGTRFLFVGGTLDRKGADLLLRAYLTSFTRSDDVCLVVKNMGTKTFYYRQTFAAEFQRAASDPHAPEIIYLEDDLAEAELASLYRACNCVVQPYRGEGFALPPLEGMACGLLPIVTAGGPTDDYLDDDTALRLPFRRKSRGETKVGPHQCVGDPWQLEPDLEALADALRWVVDHPQESKEKGKQAREAVADRWTWERGAQVARARLAELLAPAAQRKLVPAKLWSEPRRQQRRQQRRKRGGKRAGDPTLSLCMIVRDEEPRLRQCLKSIAPYVDELIVVDTGSQDRTREVARDCGARVFDFPWVDDFAAARNQSLEQATGDWIFWMDADDVIPAASGKLLRELIRKHPKKDAAFHLQVRIPPGPGEFSESVVDHVKLFPNRPGLRFEHRIHEQILPALKRAGIPIEFSDAYVVHQNYDRSEAGQEKKRLRDYRLLELDLLDHPDHPFVLYNLGMTYLYATKEFELAAHYLRRSLDRSHWKDSIIRKAYAMLTQARICQQEWQAALTANEEGRSYYPDDAELLYQAGQIYQQGNRFGEAREALERLVEGREDPHYRSVDVGLRTCRGWHELGLLFRRMGDSPHCERVLRELLAQHPDYLPAQLDLVETLHGQGQSDLARQLLAEVPADSALREQRQRLERLLEDGSPGPVGG